LSHLLYSRQGPQQVRTADETAPVVSGRDSAHCDLSDSDVVASTFKRLPDDHLGITSAVSVGGIHEIDPCIQSLVDDPDGARDCSGGKERPVRADAQRSLDALPHAAKTVFATSGVDAPVREIAEKAGVGLGTLYRHFPQRADLIAAVFRREIDACTDIAPTLAKKHQPFAAFAKWMQRYAAFVATKRGLAKALHSGEPTFDTLSDISTNDCALPPHAS
jgi:hypothetical protein